MELKIDRLSKQYGPKIAVDRVSATLSPGVYGLLGANGSGKTTLMRMVCEVLRPTSGEILLDNKSIASMGAAYRDLLGYLPQDFGYYPDFTALDFMRYIAALKGIDKKQAKQLSLQTLAEVGLEEYAKAKIKTFSGGMKQRLGIAQAVINDPKILILDEPTAGLDPQERVKFRNLISNLSKDRIVVLSTHIVSDIEFIAGKVLVMKQGAFVLEGSPVELREKMDGKVWEVSVGIHELDALQQRLCIANINHIDAETAALRIVAEELPHAGALAARPTLEDLYLYLFNESSGGALGESARSSAMKGGRHA